MDTYSDKSTAHNSPTARYRRDLESGLISPDPAQGEAVRRLQAIHDGLRQRPGTTKNGFIGQLLARNRPRWPAVAGAYIWGRVGRGKTYLVDTFFDCLPFEHKTRVHFHTFMRRTHQALNRLEREVDPLKLVARDWAAQYRVICLDEFHVGDITDAMLLANLLDALINDGVTLIATSNEAPQNLYRDGLQRERFLPAIALLEQRLDVFELAGEHDYRLRALSQAPVYYRTGEGDSDWELTRMFAAIAPNEAIEGGHIEVDGRVIPVHSLADGIAWFDFDVLCRGARATGDYIEIARTHHTLIISDLPVLGNDDNDATRRLINLVDELYDRNVNLIISAAAEPEGLYEGRRLAQPFLRTISRLREMRSHEYLAREHVSD